MDKHQKFFKDLSHDDSTAIPLSSSSVFVLTEAQSYLEQDTPMRYFKEKALNTASTPRTPEQNDRCRKTEPSVPNQKVRDARSSREKQSAVMRKAILIKASSKEPGEMHILFRTSDPPVPKRTEYQLADMFTKAQPEDRFKYLVRRIGMRCLTPADLEVVRLGINPMIQPEPEDLPKDNPKLEIAVLSETVVLLQAEQADGLWTLDEAIDEQELIATLSFMAMIQEGLT
ncbi:hypothetical protein Tco_0275965 [Tanacetum coccineum]